ncbi:hypothetical protein EMIT053CA3_90002 [Pseudomonas donghuensis]
MICRPFLPRLTSVLAVAAHPAMVKMARMSKIRFIPVLNAYRVYRPCLISRASSLMPLRVPVLSIRYL